MDHSSSIIFFVGHHLLCNSSPNASPNHLKSFGPANVTWVQAIGIPTISGVCGRVANSQVSRALVINYSPTFHACVGLVSGMMEWSFWVF